MEVDPRKVTCPQSALIVWQMERKTVLMKQIFENPVLTGAMGLMVSGALMYLLRRVPVKLFWIVVNRVVSRLTILDTNAAYHWAEDWLAIQPYSKRTKRLMITQAAENDKQLTLSPANGTHLFFDGWRPVWFKREALVKSGSSYNSPTSEITISTLDLRRAFIERIYAQIRDAAESRKSLRVYTCNSWGHWSLLLKREHRSLDSVFVEKATKDRILKHIEWYLANRQWYIEHGIPYRTGVLLFGPPGTGKTSLIHAIAGAFDLSVYMMNPSDLDSENSLRQAMATISPRSILLIEDADASIAPRAQVSECKSSVGSMPESAPVVIEKKGPTLSAVLNSLDGLAAADGRILFMTTNHKERLDEALIRDGRIDLKAEMGKLGQEEALQMAVAFLPGADVFDLVHREGPKTGAEWQTFFANKTKPAY